MNLVSEVATPVLAPVFAAIIIAGLGTLRRKTGRIGLDEAMGRAQQRLEVVSQYEDWGEFAWAAEIRKSAFRGPISKMVRFEWNRAHPGWLVLLAACVLAYMLAVLVMIMVIFKWISWGLEYAEPVVSFSLLAFLVMLIVLLVWRVKAERQMQKELEHRVDQAWVHVLFGADPASNDTLTP